MQAPGPQCRQVHARTTCTSMGRVPSALSPPLVSTCSVESVRPQAGVRWAAVLVDGPLCAPRNTVPCCPSPHLSAS